MLPETELRRLSQSKPSPKLRIEHLDAPFDVTTNVAYNFPGPKEALTWLQKPENAKSRLGKKAISALNDGYWQRIIVEDYQLVLLRLRTFIANGPVDPFWIKQAQEDPWALEHQEELNQILSAVFEIKNP